MHLNGHDCEDLDKEPVDEQPVPTEDKNIDEMKYLLLTGKGKTKDIRRVIIGGNIL
ncbi:MAG: hypothetical protein H7843_07830 [Nitrospirota bacterium]